MITTIESKSHKRVQHPEPNLPCGRGIQAALSIHPNSQFPHIGNLAEAHEYKPQQMRGPVQEITEEKGTPKIISKDSVKRLGEASKKTKKKA